MQFSSVKLKLNLKTCSSRHPTFYMRAKVNLEYFFIWSSKINKTLKTSFLIFFTVIYAFIMYLLLCNQIIEILSTVCCYNAISYHSYSQLVYDLQWIIDIINLLVYQHAFKVVDHFIGSNKNSKINLGRLINFSELIFEYIYK